MVNKNNVQRLIKTGKWTGKSLGIAMILNIAEFMKGNPEILSTEQVNEAMNKLERKDGLVYNKYVDLYNVLTDLYNFCNTTSLDAISNYHILRTYISGIMQAEFTSQVIKTKPVEISERQYSTYKTKLKKYIKNTTADIANLKTCLAEIVFRACIDSDVAKPILEKYKHETVSDKYLTELNDNIKSQWGTEPENPEQYYAMPEIFTGYYVLPDGTTSKDTNEDDFKAHVHTEQLKLVGKKFSYHYHDKNGKRRIASPEQTFKEWQEQKNDAGVKLAYEKEIPLTDALNLLEEEAPLYKLEAPFKWVDEPTDPITKDTTKYEVLHTYLSDLNGLEDGEDNIDEYEDIADFISDEYSELIDVVLTDLKKNDKVRALLDNAPDDIFEWFSSNGAFAKAGMPYYQDILAPSNSYDLTDVMPESIRHTAKNYGYLIKPSSKNSDITTTFQQHNIGKNHRRLLNQLLNSTSLQGIANDQQILDRINSSYESVQQGINYMRAFEAFIDGLIEYTNKKELADLKNFAPFHRLHGAIQDFNKFVYLEYHELATPSLNYDNPITKKQKEQCARDAKTFKKIFKPVAIDNLDVPEEAQKTVRALIASFFDLGNDTKVTASKVLQDIAGGL
ncbi:hypothetical protein [Lentilactobacillus kefiri]|uniref:Uncharacterized protein n=2 Tax=Lentilactobacillus kefiri TaxID=33962 RepID=A0A8E1RJY0_LENKE|nr:hypothetical protein [Lentilactobacillus kefiri]KRL75184.1 hypothetical protein FD08_GL003968 [Lentilactobacillus parakefiri DSM 10551]KRM52821.1 hypothetical protein FC95_GL001070 [Lentilactobacillus kefiri DSM 20587 = JCM 5818]GEL29286.1 hypothetical protein LKE01_21060 [Lentilactobacillus kefiri]